MKIARLFAVLSLGSLFFNSISAQAAGRAATSAESIKVLVGFKVDRKSVV